MKGRVFIAATAISCLLCGAAAAQDIVFPQAVTYYSPVVGAAPVVTYRAPTVVSAPVITHRPVVAAPVVTYRAPTVVASPVVTYRPVMAAAPVVTTGVPMVYVRRGLFGRRGYYVPAAVVAY